MTTRFMAEFNFLVGSWFVAMLCCTTKTTITTTKTTKRNANWYFIHWTHFNIRVCCLGFRYAKRDRFLNTAKHNNDEPNHCEWYRNSPINSLRLVLLLFDIAKKWRSHSICFPSLSFHSLPLSIHHSSFNRIVFIFPFTHVFTKRKRIVGFEKEGG